MQIFVRENWVKLFKAQFFMVCTEQIIYNQVVSEYKRHQHIKLQTKITNSQTQEVTTDNITNVFCSSSASKNG